LHSEHFVKFLQLYTSMFVDVTEMGLLVESTREMGTVTFAAVRVPSGTNTELHVNEFAVTLVADAVPKEP